MNGVAQQVRVLLVIVAVLVGVIFGLVAGILAVLAGTTVAAAVAVSGGAFLTTVPVVLGVQKVLVG
jgi:hypothetical protein